MSSIRFTQEHLKWLNDKLADQGPEKVLTWCEDTLPHLIQGTSFGPTGMVIIDMLHRLSIKMPVFFIDTLHHFPETLEHVSRAQAHYDLDVRIFRSSEAETQDEFSKKFGSELWKLESDKYDEIVKVEPQRRALRELDCFSWINGRRRSQGGERSKIVIMEYDVDSRLKVSPLAYWGYDQVWEYIKKNKVPYNSLHDNGYKSVGDWMTSFPVREGGDERSGRWQGSAKTECGIHIKPPSSSSKL